MLAEMSSKCDARQVEQELALDSPVVAGVAIASMIKHKPVPDIYGPMASERTGFETGQGQVRHSMIE